MSLITLRNSLINLQKERLNILVKELYHIENILDFFNGNDNKKETPMQKNISYIQYDIKMMKKEIQELNNLLSLLNSNDSTKIKFLIEFNYSKLKIEEFLKVVDAIYNKMRQMFNENLTQYIPYPSYGRRYSNNSLVIYLESYFRDIFKQLIDDKKDENLRRLIFNWDYRSDFTYRKFYSPEISKDQTGLYNYYIDLPYSYYELVYLIPSITYNMIHIIIKNRLNKTITNQFNKVLKNMKEEVIDKSDLMHHVYDLMGHNKYLKDLLLDIFSDKIAFDIHKESYIFTLAHQALGEGLADSFMAVNEDKSYNIVVNQWNFSQEKDHIILRLWLLLYYREKQQDKRFDEKIDELKNYLKVLIDLESNEINNDSFKHLYKNLHPNFYEAFESVELYLKIFYNFFIKQSTRISVETKNFEIANTLLGCWDNRFELSKKNINLIHHPTNFRIKLHNNLLNREKEFYTLRLIKIRKDGNADIEELEKGLIKQEKLSSDDNSNKDNNTIKQYNFISYGIYDFINLKEVKTEVNLEKQFKWYQKDNKQNIKFFEIKHILFRVDKKGIYKRDISEELKINEFSAMISIVLKKNIQNKDGYKNLPESIEKIEEIVKGYKYMILKSLGPEDLILFIFNISILKINNIIKKIYENEYIHRTYTAITHPYIQNNSLCIKNKKFEKNIIPVSYIRLKDDISKLSSINTDKIDKIVSTSGITDIKIVWKEEKVSLEDINKFYKDNTKFISDYTTKFEIKN